MNQNLQSQVRTAPTINSNSIILRSILAKTVKIEKILKNNIIIQVKAQKVENQDKRKLADIAKEEEKKKKKPKLNLGQKIKDKIPKTGILDSIANFIVFTFFGWLFTQTEKYLPKLLGIVHLLKGAADGIGWVTRFLLDAFSGFISAGYKVYDTIKGVTDGIKAKPIKEKFDSVGKALYDTFDELTGFFDDIVNITKDIKVPEGATATQPSPKIPVKGAANGSYIGSTRGGIPTNLPPTRELKASNTPKKPQKQTLPEGRIGKDIGGEQKVREFYRSPKVGVGGVIGIFRPKGAPIRKTPVDTISDISKTLKGRNSLFGDLASVGSEVAIGKRPDKNVYRNAAKDVVYLAQFIAQNQEDKLRSAVVGMAYGGTVPNRMRGATSRANLVDLVEGVIKYSVERRVNAALNSLRGPMTFVGRTGQKTGGPGRPDVSFGPDGTPYFDGGYGAPGGGGYGSPGGGYSGGMYGGYKPRSGLEREIYEYLTKEKNLSDVQALGLMANIDRESSFIPSNKEPGGTGVGLFQWSHARVTPFMKAVPDWRTNWKAQIDYALREPGEPGPQYLSTRFSSAQEAADWWMSKWERPADKRGGSIKHSEYLRGVPKGPTGSAVFRAPEKGGMGENADYSKNALLIEGGLKPSTRGLLTSPVGYRIHPITGEWKMHQGNDYALPQGTKISVTKPGRVVFSGVMGGYGNVVEVLHSDGSKSFYAHLAAKGADVGMSVKPGQVIGLVGSTGDSTGPHLHFEYKDANGEIITDPKYLTNIADATFRFGGNVVPSEVQKLAKKNGQEGYINAQGEFVKRQWTLEQRKRFEDSKKQSPKPQTTKPNQSALPDLTKGDFKNLFTENTIITSSTGTPKNRIVNFANELKEKLKKTKKGEFIDIIHKGERFSLKNMGDGKFSAYGKNKTIEGRDFYRDLNYAITTNRPFGEIKTIQTIEDEKLPQKMKDQRKRNEKLMDKKWRFSTLVEPTLDEVNSRIANSSVGEHFDIVYKGQRFTLKRKTSVDIETYTKGQKLNPGELYTAMISNKPYSVVKAKNKSGIGANLLIGGGLLLTGAALGLATGATLPFLAAAGVGVGVGVGFNEIRRKVGGEPTQGRGTGRPLPQRGATMTMPRTGGSPQGRGTGRPLPQRGATTTTPTTGGSPQGRGTGRSRIRRKKTGGLIGNSNILSNYASYEGYGGVSLIAIQPMIIQQPVPMQQQVPVPIPFPVASGVNNNNFNRA